MAKHQIPDKGTPNAWSKPGDRRTNYGTKADQYMDKKYGPSKVERRADTGKPPA
jgi:hypothetical protein